MGSDAGVRRCPSAAEAVGAATASTGEHRRATAVAARRVANLHGELAHLARLQIVPSAISHTSDHFVAIKAVAEHGIHVRAWRTTLGSPAIAIAPECCSEED